MRIASGIGALVLWACANAGYAADPACVTEARRLAAGAPPDIILPRSASAGHAVTVESKALDPGETATIGVYVRNDAAIRALVIPLVIREVDPGAFWTAGIPAFEHSARIDGYLNGIYQGQVVWQQITNTWTDVSDRRRLGLDYVSPDYVLFAAGGILQDNDLPAGDDGTVESGKASLTITLTAGNTPGQFVIDTAMIPPANHILFILGGQRNGVATGVVPDFMMGTITIRAPVVVADTGNVSVPGVEPPSDSLISDTTMVVDTTANAPDTALTVVPDPPLDSTLSWNPADWVRTSPAPVATSDEQTTAGLSNFPNPFNAGTMIRYVIEDAGAVTLSVYNILGQKVAALVDTRLAPGEYYASWDGRNMSGATVTSGIYLYRLQTGPNAHVGKMILLR